MPLSTDDAVAIQQLYARYNHLVDSGRGAEWAATFVEEGTLDTGMGFAVDGTPAARTEFGDNVPVMMPGSRHVASNVWIDGDGATAEGSAYLQLWVADEETGGVEAAGERAVPRHPASHRRRLAIRRSRAGARCRPADRRRHQLTPGRSTRR